MWARCSKAWAKLDPTSSPTWYARLRSPCPPPTPRIACAYVAERVRREAPRRWVQGPRCPPLDPGEHASELIRLFAARDIYRLPRAVSEAIVAWATGARRVELWRTLPRARQILAMQARGVRCVSLVDDADVPEGPIAGLPRGHGAYGSGGLAFAVHDLCHLEKFFSPAHHLEQVGFFAALERALAQPAWAAVDEGFDDAWRHDRDQVLADMNGASAFLYVVLRNKVKLAVRRRTARERGEPCRDGPLDEGEAREYAAVVAVLAEALGLEGEAREAALVLASRHEATVSGAPLAAFFERAGAAALAAAGHDGRGHGTCRIRGELPDTG